MSTTQFWACQCGHDAREHVRFGGENIGECKVCPCRSLIGVRLVETPDPPGDVVTIPSREYARLLRLEAALLAVRAVADGAVRS